MLLVWMCILDFTHWRFVYTLFHVSSRRNTNGFYKTWWLFSAITRPVADNFNCLYQQRPPFFSFKMGIPPAITRALKLSGIAYLISTALVLFLPHQFLNYPTVGKFIAEQIRFYLGSFAVFLSWELSHHLHRVGSSSLLTQLVPSVPRSIFFSTMVH